MDKDILERQRKAGKITAEALEMAKNVIRDGYSLLSLAEEMEEHMRKRGAFPAFPVNISIDDAAAHFTPASDCELTFRRGEVAKIDCGACYEGYIGDSAITIEVGNNTHFALIESARRGLERAIKEIRAGMRAGEVGGIIEREINSMGYVPIENLSGHEVAEYNLHAGISIPNIADRSAYRIEEGMFIAIEPFATSGKGYVIEKENGNIYQFLERKKIHNESATKLMEMIASDRALSSLPFCERWCVKMGEAIGIGKSDVQKALKMLVKSRVLRDYPVLREVSGALVSQWEHTLYIKDEGCEVLTSL